MIELASANIKTQYNDTLTLPIQAYIKLVRNRKCIREETSVFFTVTF